MLPKGFGVLALLLLSAVTTACGVNSTRIKMGEQKPLYQTEETQETTKVTTKGTSNQGPESVKSQIPKQGESASSQTTIPEKGAVSGGNQVSTTTSTNTSSETSTTQSTTSNSTPMSPATVVTNPSDPQPDARWESEIKAIVKERCSRCHSYFAEYKFVIGQRLDIIPRLAPNAPAGFRIMPDPGSPEGLAMTLAEKQTLSQYLEGK